jgi:hypothetical protein
MHIRPFFHVLVAFGLCSLADLLSIPKAYAQVSFTGLATNSTVNACDEFATQTFQDPWDMSNTADVNNYFVGELGFIGSQTISAGLFNFNTTLTGNGQIHLLTPAINNVQPVGGRFGQNFPIDVSKYDQIAIRMNLQTWDEGQGLKVQWDHGTLAADPTVRQATLTQNISTVPGWKTYVVDLTTVGLSSNSAVLTPWTSGGITGLSFYPTVTTQSVQVDYVRLEDRSTCGSANIAYSAATQGNNDLYSLYLDNDSDPFNGYYTKFVSAGTPPGATSQAVTASGLVPNSYKLVGVLDGDFASLEHDNPWNFDDAMDVQAAGAINNATLSGGTYSGTTANGDSGIYLVKSGGGRSFDAAKYNRMSIKVTNSSGDIWVLWGGTGGGGFKSVNSASMEHQGGGIYHINLAGAGMTGTINELIIRPSTNGGATFSLDWVRLRKTGYVSNETVNATPSTGNFIVSNPPTVKVLQPDQKGGEAVRPWNFRPTDVLFSVNHDGGTDPAFPTEGLTSYLPDVRLVGGVRGDFFKGTNEAGDGDPNDYMNFPFFSTPSFTFDGTQYHNICLKMMLDRDYDLALGSVTKFHFKKADSLEEKDFDAFATIFDRWSGNRWYEYCMDLSAFPTETGTFEWSGTIDALRIDPHEFSFDSCCDSNGLPIGNPIQVTYYYDYLKLRKDDESRGLFSLVYDLADVDTASPTLNWYYSTSKTETGGTAIPSGDLSCDGRVCIWNTANVPTGNYYVYAQVSDGSHSNSDVSSGTVQVTNSGSTGTQPTLAVEAPISTAPYCDSLQVKGYALMANRLEDVAAVQVFIDGAFFAKIHPSNYSPAAVTNHPSADASTSGFDEFHSLASISAGSHSVVIKAYSTDGGVTPSSPITITKSTGCTDPVVSDAAPAGIPQAATLADDPSAEVDADGPTLSGVRHNGKGSLKLAVSNIGTVAEGCRIKLLGGATDSAVTTEIKTFTVKKKDERRSRISLAGNRIMINKRSVPTIYLQAQRVCGGATSNGAISSLAVKTKKGKSDITSALRLLTKLKPPKAKR